MSLDYRNRIVAGFVFFLTVLTMNLLAEGSAMEIKDKDRTTVESSISAEGCTIEEFEVFSKSMERGIKVVVILPPEYKDNPGKKYPILYTLHGYAAPFDTFSKMSPLREALKDKPMIVTCLDGDKGSWYLDSTYTQKDYSNEENKKGAPARPPVKSLFTTFFFDEFVPFVDKYYRVNPSQRMVTGFSMGGFGAFHYMLTKPKMFASVSALSGSLVSLVDDGGLRKWLVPVLGNFSQHRDRYEETDMYNRVKKCVANKEKLPPVFLHSGTEDGALPGSEKMAKFLQSNGFDCKFEKSPGKHDWAFWKGASAGIIDFHWKTLKEHGK